MVPLQIKFCAYVLFPLNLYTLLAHLKLPIFLVICFIIASLRKIRFMFVFTATSGVASHFATPPLMHPTWPTNDHHFWRTFKVESQPSITVADNEENLSPHEMAYRKYTST